MSNQLEEALKLPAKERLLVAEILWESVEEQSNTEWQLSEEWKNEIDKRYQLYKEGKTDLFTWNEVKDHLSKLK